MFSHLECSPATSVERVHKPHKIPLHLQLFSSCCCSCTDISSPPPATSPCTGLSHINHKTHLVHIVKVAKSWCHKHRNSRSRRWRWRRVPVATLENFCDFLTVSLSKLKDKKPQPEELGRCCCCCCWLRRAARTRRTRWGRARKKLQAPNEFLFLPPLFLLLLMLLAFRQS